MIAPIMDEADYPGIRVFLDTTLETMHTPMKIDFSTGDAITPHEISYSYKRKFDYAADIQWKDAMQTVRRLYIDVRLDHCFTGEPNRGSTPDGADRQRTREE